MKYDLNFYTSYNQFYLYDKESSFRTDSPLFWNRESHSQRLAVEEGILGIGTGCYGPAKGELILLNDAVANINLSEYDHVVEGGIEIKSGVLQVMDCPNSEIELELHIKPGNYRVRVYSKNLASIVGDEGDDYYKIEIWPGENLERMVIKQFKN